MKLNHSFTLFAWLCFQNLLVASASSITNAGMPSPTVVTPANGTYNVLNQPVLRALSLNAPRDKQGNLIPIPKMEFNSLTDPLQGRYALLSRSGTEFSIVPRVSLMIPAQCTFAKEAVQEKIPKGTYLEIGRFLLQEASRFTIIHLQPNHMGLYQMSLKEEKEFLQQSPGRLILFLDKTCNLPITSLQRESATPLLTASPQP